MPRLACLMSDYHSSSVLHSVCTNSGCSSPLLTYPGAKLEDYGHTAPQFLALDYTINFQSDNERNIKARHDQQPVIQHTVVRLSKHILPQIQHSPVVHFLCLRLLVSPGGCCGCGCGCGGGGGDGSGFEVRRMTTENISKALID
jgi:hypothetical protein